MRRSARENCLSLIFEYMFLGTRREDDEIVNLNSEDDTLTPEDIKFMKKIYNGVVDSFEDLKNEISGYVTGYKPERVYKVDLAILILSVYELKQGETPVSVVVDEAVRLAKIYSTEDSMGFINGILGNYVKKVILKENNTEK